MEINKNKDDISIILNNHEIDIFKELLRNTSSYLDEYGYQVDIDLSVDKMINELWDKLKVIKNEQ